MYAQVQTAQELMVPLSAYSVGVPGRSSIEQNDKLWLGAYLCMLNKVRIIFMFLNS